MNIVGNPNVGKSTLMNQLVGERISIATFKAQTTRHRIMGIVNTPEMQIVFSDTPGVLKPNYKLQESMLQFSQSALVDADVLLYVTDTVEQADKNEEFVERVRGLQVPVLVLINKIDLSNQKELGDLVEKWHERLPNAEIIPISATNKFNVDVVMKRIQELLPDSPPFFDKDQWTDKPARFFVTEIIREKILLYYDKEIALQGRRQEDRDRRRDLRGAGKPEGHHHRPSGSGHQESDDRGTQGAGTLLREERVPEKLCESRQGLAQQRQGAEELWVQPGGLARH